MVNSKQKGSRFERFCAHLFNLAGYKDARRGQQFSGLNGDADIVGVPFIHIEAKHRENGHGSLYDWMAQSIRDARAKELPIVIHKKNQKSVLVTMEFKDWIKLYCEFEKNMRKPENVDIYFGDDNRNDPYNRPIVFHSKKDREER